MGQLVKSYIRRFRKAHRKTRRRASVLFVLAVFVAVGVFWQLRATGIAMINETDCGLTEHTHTDACYEDVLVCNILASSSHTHTAECYEKILVCGLEEHTHTVECIIDTTADVETAEDWEATLPELTGVWADDVVAIAESQLGYTESTANYTLDEDSTSHKGYTRYGEWAENLYGDWDGLFAMFCLSYAGISEEDYPMSAGANAWVVQLEESGFYAEATEVTPQIGDLIFLDTDEDGTADRVGILTALDEETLTVVQGDYAETEGEAEEMQEAESVEAATDTTTVQSAAEEIDAVCQVEYAVGDAVILGYGVLPTQEVQEVQEVQEAQEAQEVQEAQDAQEVQEAEEAQEAESAEAETDTNTLQSATVRLMATNNSYNTESEFYLFIHNNSDSSLGPTNYEDTSKKFTNVLSNVVLSYTDDDDSSTYYLIPVSYFETYLGGTVSSYKFDPTNTEDCALYYAPDAEGASLANATSKGKYVYVGSKDEDADSTNDSEGWYLRVQDTGTTYSSPRRSNVYYIPPTQSIVLNLGNNNGTDGSTQYGGDTTGTTLRYTVDLSKVVDGNQEASIYLPSNNNLDQIFTVSDAGTADTSDDVTVNLGKEAKYDYKLVGWYNIATGEYYDVSGDSVTATVSFYENNVFYADWIAESYSIGELDSSVVKQVETEDTSSFVTIHMFDYNELFNLYSTSLTQTGLTSETWTDILSSSSTPLEESALKSSFIFFGTEMVTIANKTKSGLLMNAANRLKQNLWTGHTDLRSDYQYGQYPGLLSLLGEDNTTNSTLLQMLFNTEADADDYGVTYVGTGNYLFSYSDDTCEYSFNSEKSTAVYDVDGDTANNGGRFYVYDATQTLGTSNTGSFLPYNQYSSSGYSLSDGLVNYWFGLEMEVNFYLPQDTSEGSEGSPVNTISLSNGSTADMEFNFSGDDDVWIFVDDELVLDLGGDHNRLDGTINFSTNTTSITNHPAATSGYDSTTKTTGGLDLSAGSHTLKVYYLERGASASNLAMSFTLPPAWICQSEEAQTVVAEKTWYNAYDEEITGTATANCPSVLMGLFKGYMSSEYTVQDFTYTVEGTDYTLDSSGNCYDTDGSLLAYLKGDGTLFVLVDTQTLSYNASAENYGWAYTWKLLDDDATYEVQELNRPTESEYVEIKNDADEDETDTTYWEVVNYEDLADMIAALGDGETLTIALTDGAQTADTTNRGSYPETVTGYAIKSDGYETNTMNGIGTDSITFSQAAEWLRSSTYIYGAAVDIPADAQWTLVPISGSTDTFNIKGFTVTVPTFYLVNEKNFYLRVVKPNGAEPYLTLTDTTVGETAATPFSYNTLGELNTNKSTGLRVIIEDGKYALAAGRQNEYHKENVKIYLQAAYSKTTYTAVNKLKAYTMPEAGGSGVQTYWIFGAAISGSVSVGLLRKGLRRHRRKSA